MEIPFNQTSNVSPSGQVVSPATEAAGVSEHQKGDASMTTMLETKPAVTEEDVERTIAELESVLKNF